LEKILDAPTAGPLPWSPAVGIGEESDQELPLGNLRAIVAVGPGGVIGLHGRIPWHLPEDLRHFRRLTVGHTVIVGRKTLQSLGRPLPERENWVLSRSLPAAEGCRVLHSREELLAALKDADPGRQFWAMGGGEIYRQLLPLCVEVVCTEVFLPCSGDTFWEMPPDFVRGKLLLESAGFTAYLWQRKTRK
jgi:dihydrofolate reductase